MTGLGTSADPFCALREPVQLPAVRLQPGAVRALVADQPAGLGPEGRTVVGVQQMGALVGGDVVGGSGGSTGEINAGLSMKSVNIGGSLIGGSLATGNAVEFSGVIFGGAIGSITIAGDIRGGRGDV